MTKIKIKPNGEIYRWYVEEAPNYVFDLVDDLTNIVFKYQNANIFQYMGDFVSDSENEVIVVVGAQNLKAAAYIIVKEITDLGKLNSIEKNLEAKGISPFLIQPYLINKIMFDLKKGLLCADPLDGFGYEHGLEWELEHRLDLRLTGRGYFDSPSDDPNFGIEAYDEYSGGPYDDDELAELHEDLNLGEDFSKPIEMVLEEEKIELLKFLSNEKHFSYFLDEPQEEKIENGVLTSTPISQIQPGKSYLIKGYISCFRSLFIHTICVQCLKNMDDCSCQDNGTKKEILMFHLEIDDETGKVDCIFLDSVAERLVHTKIELVKQIIDNPDFKRFLDNLYSVLIGKDIYIRGKAEFWKILNRLLIIIKIFRDVDIDEELNAEIKRLANSIEFQKE